MKRKNDEGGETNIKNKTQQQQQQLPHELITEILLRLPVKSLIRFKCVCKSWLSLISDPHFATSHFDFTAAACTHRIVLITSHASETQSIDNEASLNEDAATVSLNLHFLIPQSYLTLQIGGSSRGFLFLHCYHSLYLWNPSTGIHKQIPCSSSNVNTQIFTYLYGFGYDPSTDDYLVVLGHHDPADANVLTYFEYFSLRANTWKKIEGAYWPYLNASDNPRVGTLFNGAIHWLAYSANLSVIIVAFDLTERRILEIPLPNNSDFNHDPTDCELWVGEGFMSLWAMDFGNDTLEIWVMEEYGVNSSWTKTFVMSIDEIEYFSPICSTNCGDIVGSDRSTGLLKLNEDGQLIERRSYCNHPPQVAVYTESLLQLPLPRDTQQA